MTKVCGIEDCDIEVRPKQGFCKAHARERKLAVQSASTKNTNALIKGHGWLSGFTDVTKKRAKKAEELRKRGYDVPWESSNGYE